MLDNIADLLLTVSLLHLVFGFPVKFALECMVPGTAIGVLVGDLLFFAMARQLARKIGRNDITSMPLGLDTPSTFGMVFFVLGPAFLHARYELALDETQAATYAWQIGICSIVLSGLFKFACALGSGWVRKMVPRAGLLGSLAAVALVLISFLPLLEILEFPVVGFVALAIILTTLIARVPLPFKLPGALGAVFVAGGIYYAMLWTGTLGHDPAPLGINPREALLPHGWLSTFSFSWLATLDDSLQYLPLVVPFALATVVGGIDCVESAAAAGDEFPTGKVIAVDALATLLGGLCGGVIQTTPYIGHPAYKAMGGRAAYTLATALFVGGAGVIGYFGYLYVIIPKPTVFPILMFIGLEITAQSFHATPRRHYAAVAIACVPALAFLAMIFVGDLQGQYAGQVGQLQKSVAALESALAPQANTSPDSTPDATSEGPPASEQLLAALDNLKQQANTLESMAGNPATGRIGQPQAQLGKTVQTLRMLSGGFIITSLLWASMLAAMLDHRLFLSAAYGAIAAGCSLFGIIHSPLPGSPLVNPFALPANLPHAAAGQTPLYMAGGYAAMAVVMCLWGLWWWKFAGAAPTTETDQAGEAADAGAHT